MLARPFSTGLARLNAETSTECGNDQLATSFNSSNLWKTNTKPIFIRRRWKFGGILKNFSQQRHLHTTQSYLPPNRNAFFEDALESEEEDDSDTFSYKNILDHFSTDQLILKPEYYKDTVLDIIENPERRIKGMAQFKRHAILNDIFGGFRPGEVTVLSGPTGCGKTTFTSEIALDMALQGVKTLFASFELRNEFLIHTMLSQFLRTEIQQIPEIQRRQSLHKFFDDVPLQLVRKSDFNFNIICDKILEWSQMQPRAHIIIDNLQYFVAHFANGGDNDCLRVAEQKIITKFTDFVKENAHVHITVISHLRKSSSNGVVGDGIDSIMGSARIAQEADNIIMIRQLRKSKKIIQQPLIPVPKPVLTIEERMKTSTSRYLQVLKNRYTGNVICDNEIVVEFDPRTRCTSLSWNDEMNL